MAHEFSGEGFAPVLGTEQRDLFSELREFWNFLREELKPFPGRGHAVVRLVLSTVLTVILSETLRVPEPAFSAYLVFFIANEDGVSSVKFGLLAMASLTLTLIIAMGVNICFMDAPWFRLPVTFVFIALAIWLSRVLVLTPLGRLMAVVLALYLSLADTIFDPEELTESTLWLWSIVGLAVGVSVAISLVLEPRPDLLLREQIEDGLDAVQRLIEGIVSGRIDRQVEPESMRRRLYGTPQLMRQLLARWRQRAWPAIYRETDWELAIFIVGRLLSISAALAAAARATMDPETRIALAKMAETIGRLRQAVHDRDRETIRSLALPAFDGLPDSAEKVALTEYAAALEDCRFVLAPSAKADEADAANKKAASKMGVLIPDALTNPEYLRFTIKTTLAILACEIFMNAVAWPGIRTSMITCVVTALATAGAQRQKQLLRLSGVCLGGLMGLVSILYLIPLMNSIVGLTLLVAAGGACCAWVAAGSVRSSYAGFQMALAFFIMLLPGFTISVDLTAIRDRFVGILVGITAMWIFFELLWNISSRRQLVEKLIATLRQMAKGPGVLSSALSTVEARERAMSFRRELVADLGADRLLLDETKIELALSLKPRAVRAGQLEAMAGEVSFTAFALLALNEKKLRLLAAGRLDELEPVLRPADEALAGSFTSLADALEQFLHAVLAAKERDDVELVLPALPSVPISDLDNGETELRDVYVTLQAALHRITDLGWMVHALP